MTLSRVSRLLKLSSTAAKAFGFLACLQLVGTSAALANVPGGINPIYLTNFTETQGGVPESFFSSNPSGNYPCNGYSKCTSFGWYFDTIHDGKIVNALGMPIFSTWGSRPEPTPVDVYLWRWEGAYVSPSGFHELAKVTFDPTQTSTYLQSTGFYWIPITPVDLGPETATINTKGFAVAAVSNFTSDANNNTLNIPFLFEGSGSLSPAVTFDGNGFNSPQSSFAYPTEMPYPTDWLGNTPLDFNGYYSANVSLSIVPGPLPLMGAGVAYSWSRRLRRRITAKR